MKSDPDVPVTSVCVFEVSKFNDARPVIAKPLPGNMLETGVTVKMILGISGLVGDVLPETAINWIFGSGEL